MVQQPKGILAMDESTGTIGKRFQSVGVENTEENRRAYRELLVTAPGIEAHISGAILYEETLGQKTANGVPFAQALKQRGIAPGIKVDKGTKDLAGFPGEKITEGLDGLRERLAGFKAQGAEFAKWRAVITIDAAKGLPTKQCIEANAQRLAEYAALCHEQGLVPIVEPEVLMDGTHSLKACEKATTQALKAVFEKLADLKVNLNGIVLKPNMVVPGADSTDEATPKQVASATLKVLKKCVPVEVPGIAFLSGGIGDEEVTLYLDELNKAKAAEGAPWNLTFSFGRGLQREPLQLFGSKDNDKTKKAQDALLKRSQESSNATLGKYK